jgi:spermidine synthase
VIPRELIDTADVPGGDPLRLIRHGNDYIIMLERNELMSTRMSGSEVALGVETCRRLGKGAIPRLLIGGYGMGFTLRAVLKEVGATAQVVVAEIVPKIIDWARGPMATLADNCLDDPRVDLRIQDVAEAIAGGSYDAILLDVDNGPDAVTRADNDGLYSAAGLATIRNALRLNGVLAVWSTAEDRAFTARLKRAGFAVEELRVRARENGKGPTHTIWFATRQ